MSAKRRQTDGQVHMHLHMFFDCHESITVLHYLDLELKYQPVLFSTLFSENVYYITYQYNHNYYTLTTL